MLVERRAKWDTTGIGRSGQLFALEVGQGKEDDNRLIELKNEDAI